jgi:hypothetical protein
MSPPFSARMPIVSIEDANASLREHHPLLTVFANKRCLIPTEREAKIFERVNTYSKLNSNSYNVSDKYLETYLAATGLSPISQFSIDELHWFRGFTLLLNQKANMSNTNVLLSTGYSMGGLKGEHGEGKRYTKARETLGDKVKIRDNESMRTVGGTILLGAKDTSVFLEMCFTEQLYYEEHDRVNKATGSVWDNYSPAQITLTITPTYITEFNRDIEKRSKMSRWFPFKRKTAAHTKANVYFDDILESIRRTGPKYFDRIKGSLFNLIGMSNDQATLMMQSHYVMWHNSHDHDFKLFLSYMKNLKLVKGLSDMIKNYGVANSPYLTWYVEADALYGRGSMSVDLIDEFRRVTKTLGKTGENIQLPKGLVFQEAMLLFDEAMPSIAKVERSSRWRVFGQTEEDAWNNRSAQCVNGSHHLPNNSELPDVPRNLTGTKIAFLEQQEECFLFKTEPVIDASLAEKFENPKTRPIKSQDSVSYFHENYLLHTVEQHWKHANVLIDPSLDTKYDEAERVDRMEGDTYVMFDYTAMDMQHSIETQVELRKALVYWLGMPQNMQDYYIKMENNQFLNYLGERGKVLFSLLTGRRSTTFTNTCLCYIYLKIALGDHSELVNASYYVGDDVILRTVGMRNAYAIIQKALSSKFAFNRRKQSYGKAGEFLRHSIKGKNSYGYLNRSLASFTCGSWVNEMQIAATDNISTFNRACWTISKRAMTPQVGAIF